MKESQINLKRIYFQRIRFYHYPIVKYFINKNFKIFIFNFDLEDGKISWLRPMLDDGRVIRISHFIFGSDSIALKNVAILEPFILKSNVFRLIKELYGDENIKMVFQKALAEILSDFHSVQLVLKAEGDGKIIFYPFSYLKTYSIIKQYKGQMQELDNLEIPRLFRSLNSIDLFFLRLKAWFISNGINFYALFLLLMKFVFASRKDSRKEGVYAVAITNSDFQFRFNGSRSFDFILDGKGINKENTFFLSFSPLKDAKKNNLSELGYQILDCRRQEVFFSPSFRLHRSESFLLIARGTKYVLKNLYFSLFESEKSVYVSHTLFKTYLLWSIILKRVKFKHFITFNDEGISHIGRNILLNKHGVSAWYYAHSCGYAYSHTKHDLSLGMHRAYAFLFYDHFIAWNKPTIEYLALHSQKIGQYHNVGCLWSGFGINDNKVGNITGILQKAKIEGKNPKNCKIISFFDTTFYDSMFCDYPIKDGIQFYKDIERFLQEEQDVFVIIKEKKNRRLYSDERCLVYSKAHKEFFAQLDILQFHPRCFIAGHNFNPQDVICCSDLTVTYAFSSITVEALSARKKAIFYDPASRFKGYFYDAIPGFVAHGYDELKVFIKEMLEMPENKFDEFLNVWASPRIEDYRDGKALDRFRELLTYK